jgi:hypothetical protein
MPIPELLAFFAAGSCLVLLFYILQTLDKIHEILGDMKSELKKADRKLN